MARQALVDEGVVRGQQIQHAAVFLQDAFETAAPSRAGTTAADCRRNPGTDPCWAARCADCEAAATGPAKLSTSACDFGIGQHAAHLAVEHGRILQLALIAPDRSSSSSGMLLHKKNDSREANSVSLTR